MPSSPQQTQHEKVEGVNDSLPLMESGQQLAGTEADKMDYQESHMPVRSPPQTPKS